MFEIEKKDYEANRRYLVKAISHDLGLNESDVMPLAVDYLLTEQGYEGLLADIKKKVNNGN